MQQEYFPRGMESSEAKIGFWKKFKHIKIFKMVNWASKSQTPESKLQTPKSELQNQHEWSYMSALISVQEAKFDSSISRS